MARFMSYIADPRAVLLSRDPLLLPEHSGHVAIDRVTSAYEAAARILSSPVLALVVDLRALGRRHYRLLDVARQRSCQVLICGQLDGGLSTADLNGAQLVSLGQLPSVLCRRWPRRCNPAKPSPPAKPAKMSPNCLVFTSPICRPGPLASRQPSQSSLPGLLKSEGCFPMRNSQPCGGLIRDIAQ